jgi:hypothetical protein
MSNELLADISKKLTALVALSLRRMPEGDSLSVSGNKRGVVGERVRFLSDFGLDAKVIAEIVGSPVTSARTLLTPQRRK